MQAQDIPDGFCQCGCGSTTNPGMRYLRGHSRRHHHTEEDRGHDTPCWIWRGSVNRWGYGKTSRVRHGKRETLAHRAYYAEHVGPIPPGKQIDHRCRIPACVNPDHLEVVDAVQNTRRSAKLDPTLVAWIRATPDIPASRWASEYGVTTACVIRARNGTSWAGIDAIQPPPAIRSRVEAR